MSLIEDLRATVAIVGGGPAGLRAAEVLAGAGYPVSVYEQKPSVGRKFLVAGRGGLNLTHAEPLDAFVARYEAELPRWRELLAAFGPDELRAWAAGLGIETYVGTSRRVFPQGQQAAALLRRWMARLRGLGVAFHVNHRLDALRPVPATQSWSLQLRDLRADAPLAAEADAVILALGGASWPETGSDGTWPAFLRGLGVPVAAWEPANCGFDVSWTAELLAAAEGLPLKNITLRVGDRVIAGEALITRYGLEGGALYQLSRQLRAMAPRGVEIDLKPQVSAEQLCARFPLANPTWDALGNAWKLNPGARALLQHQARAPLDNPPQLAALAKGLRLFLGAPRPIAEAISSAGGVEWRALTADLMVSQQPGLFVAGEMIDWEAPTGGYLLQGCFATGTQAAEGVRRFLAGQHAPG
jgi:uncharacterized flavoprotein (TIGR03862 family)